MPTGYELLKSGRTPRSDPSRLVCLLRPPFGCAACDANQVVLCYGLTPASECVGSGATWLGLPCRPRSVTACDLPGATW